MPPFESILEKKYVRCQDRFDEPAISLTFRVGPEILPKSNRYLVQNIRKDDGKLPREFLPQCLYMIPVQHEFWLEGVPALPHILQQPELYMVGLGKWKIRTSSWAHANDISSSACFRISSTNFGPEKITTHRSTNASLNNAPGYCGRTSKT